MQDNVKHNKICIIGIPEGEEEEKGIENLFEKVMLENFPNLMREKVTQIQETQRFSIKKEDQIKSFLDKRSLKEYTSTKPALQEMLKGLL